MRKHAADAAPHPHMYRFRLKEVKADAAPHQMLLHQLVYDERFGDASYAFTPSDAFTPAGVFCFGDASHAFTPAAVSMRSLNLYIRCVSMRLSADSASETRKHAADA